MNKKILFRTSALVVAIFLAGLIFLDIFKTTKQQRDSQETVLRYSVLVTNQSDTFIPDTRIALSIPLSETSWQRVQTITLSPAASSIDHRNDHGEAEINLALPPYATKSIDIDARLLLFDAPAEIELGMKEQFLAPTMLVQSDSPEIRELANHLKSSSSLETARRIWEWVAANIQDTGYQRQALGARQALLSRSGDCTEFAYLYVALARAAGIHARVISGFILGGRGVVDANNLHDWAEIYINDAWRLVDPLRKTFDSDYQNYVALYRPVDQKGLILTASEPQIKVILP